MADFLSPHFLFSRLIGLNISMCCDSVSFDFIKPATTVARFIQHSCLFIFSFSLRSKRFQSSYCAKVRAGAKKKKKGGRGRGWGEEETLARKPHDSGKRPLIFHGWVDL